MIFHFNQTLELVKISIAKLKSMSKHKGVILWSMHRFIISNDRRPYYNRFTKDISLYTKVDCMVLIIGNDINHFQCEVFDY